MPKRPLVCDTTVLLYLGRIDCIDLLPALFSQLYVPDVVMLELDMGRLLRPGTVDPRDFDWITPITVAQETVDALPPNRLGAGERAVIAYAHSQQGCLAGLDDLQARHLAESLGLEVAGTPGILLRARQSNLLPSVRSLIDALIAQGFRLDAELYQDILVLAGEA